MSVALCHANSTIFHLSGGKGTYVEFIVNKKKSYPIVFAAFVEKDTLKVDLTNLDSFTKSVYLYNSYMPMSSYAYQKAYDMVFGRNSETCHLCSLFYSGFMNDLDNTMTNDTLSLLSGEKIIVSYAQIIGVFMNVKVDDFWIETISSLGLDDKQNIMNIMVPISIIYNKKKVNFQILYKSEV